MSSSVPHRSNGFLGAGVFEALRLEYRQHRRRCLRRAGGQAQVNARAKGLVPQALAHGFHAGVDLANWRSIHTWLRCAASRPSQVASRRASTAASIRPSASAAGGVKAAGGKAVGKEFSHWIPNRMGGPRTIMNGNFVSTEVHALSDPYRYRFMSRAWKAANPMPNQAMQQWVRLPSVYKGAGAGGAYGAAGLALADCTCPQ